MKWNKLYQYPKSMRSLIKDERHYEIGSSKLPSVTTILNVTASSEKRESIAKWKAKVGEAEAERVKNTAATRGTAMHSYLEYHLNGQGLLDLSDEGRVARSMAQTIIDKGLGDLQEIWGNEVVVRTAIVCLFVVVLVRFECLFVVCCGSDCCRVFVCGCFSEI